MSDEKPKGRLKLPEPMTTTEIASAILKAHGVEGASKDDVQNVALGIQHTLKNHEGKGVQKVEGAWPAKWALIGQGVPDNGK